MLRAGGVRGDEGQADGGGGHAGQLDLGLLGGLFQSLHGHFVAPQVDALCLLELVGQPVDDALVEVVAAQTVVARRGQHFLHAVAHLDDGNVEGAAAQVVDHDLLILFLVDAVGQRRRRGLVDDPLDLKAGDLARVLGGLPLGVREIRRNGDDRFRHLAADIRLRVGLQLGKDHGGDLLRRVGLVVDPHSVVAAHLSLDGGDGAVRLGDGLTLCHLTDHSFAGLAEGDHRGGGSGAFRVGDHDGLAALNDRYAGVGST